MSNHAGFSSVKTHSIPLLLVAAQEGCKATQRCHTSATGGGISRSSHPKTIKNWMMVLVRCHLKVIQTIIQFMFELTLPVCSNFERSLEVKSRAVFTVFLNLPVRSGGARFSQTKPYVIAWVQETRMDICILMVDDVDIFVHTGYAMTVCHVPLNIGCFRSLSSPFIHRKASGPPCSDSKVASLPQRTWQCGGLRLKRCPFGVRRGHGLLWESTSVLGEFGHLTDMIEYRRVLPTPHIGLGGHWLKGAHWDAMMIQCRLLWLECPMVRLWRERALPCWTLWDKLPAVVIPILDESELLIVKIQIKNW